MTNSKIPCELPGCTGFSCPYCAKCTAECPNMACQREGTVDGMVNLAARIVKRAGEVRFTNWGDRPLTVTELAGVLLEESK